MKRSTTIALAAALTICGTIAYPQSKFLKTFQTSAGPSSASPPSNSISQIAAADTVLWIGTGKGVSKSLTSAGSWVNYAADPSFANSGIFALAVNSDTAWTSTGYEKEVTDATVQTGSGYTFTVNGGGSWQHRNQTLDLPSDSILAYGINDSIYMLPVVVPEQNVTFDISLSAGTVWIASWASGLRRSTDQGATWERILLPADDQNSISPMDTLWTYAATDTLQLHRIYRRYDPRRNNNMLAFGVHAVDNDTIWCGTAGGINKSTDGGVTWKKFSHQNQLSGIGGNWVIAIDHQIYHGKLRMWATTWRANDSDEDNGVSYSDDGGISWTNILAGVKAYDFAFKDSIVYIATDDGIFRTEDGGVNFSRFSRMMDQESHQLVASSPVYSVGVIRDTVFAGTGDGLASTVDGGTSQFGSEWNVYRTYQPVAGDASYAYPNPFAPHLGPVRIHYFSGSGSGSASISIDIFDYGMNRVRSLVHEAARPANAEFDEVWDGRDDNGRIVANGVYFYRIARMGSDEHSFGKILTIQ